MAAVVLIHWLFFAEYLPPFSRVFIPYDLEGYHYPLFDFAFRELKAGRLPEWDSTIYCGIPLSGNIQAAVLYPPTWLLFLLNAGKSSLPYRSLEIFVLAHVWLAFALAYRWFKARGYEPLACWLGAAVFAYSGYMMTQLQHFGLVCGVAWWPAAFQAVDDAAARRSARPLWIVSGVSALVILAGYPPLWAAFAVFICAYAMSAGVLLRTAGALAFSLALAAVQLWPAIEANRLVAHFSHYGAGVRDIAQYLTFVLPNYHAFGLNVPIETNRGLDYWYLGAPGILGILFSRREVWGAWLVAAAALFFLTNPWLVVSEFVERYPMVASALRSWYFMPGLTAGAALLAASGWNHILSRPRRTASTGLLCVLLLAATAWCARLLQLWIPFDAVDFTAGPSTGIDLAIGISLCAALASYSGQRKAPAVALALFALIELKAFGTSRRFNATQQIETESPTATMSGFDPETFAKLRSDPAFRVAGTLEGGPWVNNFRHYGLSAVQGNDPLLSATWRETVEAAGVKFVSDRDFTVDPANRAFLRQFGVKYFASRSDNPIPGFHRIGTEPAYFTVFELDSPSPAYVFSGQQATVVEWAPNRRVFDVDSEGVMQLTEQWFPGWQARIDNSQAATYRCGTAFVCVNVPAGRHRVEFYYASRSLRIGAAVSVLSLLLLVFWSRSAKSLRYPPRPDSHLDCA